MDDSMDREMRSLGRAARAEVEADLDIDAAWGDVGAGRSTTRPSIADPTVGAPPPARWPWLAAAAALVLAVAGGIVLLRDDDSIQTAEPTVTTTVPTTPTSTPITVPTTEISAEPAPPTTVAPTTTTATVTSPPTGSDLSVSFRNPPPELQLTPLADIEIGAASNGSLSVAIGELGVAVDRSDAGLVTVIGFDGNPRDVDITAAGLPEGGLSAIAYGPGDVLYGLYVDGPPYEFRIAAIPLSGPSAGQIVARSEGLGAAAWTELPVSPLGHGLDGIVARARDVGATLMGYVDELGQPREIDGLVPPFATIDDEAVVTSDVGWEWPLDIERDPAWSVALTGPDVPAPTSGLRVVYPTTIGAPLGGGEYPDHANPVIAVLAGEGAVTGQWWSLPDGWRYAASDLWGTVFVRGDDRAGTMQLALLPGGPQTWRAFPSEGSRVRRNCVDERPCSEVVVGPSGTPISYDPVTHTLTNHGVPAISVPLPTSYIDVWIEAVGPDDVAYLVIRSDEEFEAEVVAVPTRSPELRELGRWSGVTSYIGDGDLVAGTDGLIDVGCCGEATVRPAVDDPLAVPWVDDSGAVITGALPTVIVRHTSLVDYSIERDGRIWPFRSPVGITGRAMRIIPTFDGGVIAAFSTIGGGETVVARGWPDGTVDTVWLDTWISTLDPAGVVLFENGDRFARVQLFDDRAQYWDGERIIDVGGTGALDLPGLNDDVQQTRPAWALDPTAFAHAIAGAPAINETRAIDVVRTSEFAWTATVTTAGFFDDSIFAARLELELGRSDVDGTFRFEGGRWSQACAPNRGHQDFTPELCV